MNSGLQCLSNTYGLTDFFLTNKYKKDINETNVLGTGGSLARKYANFCRNMWYGTSRSFSPWGLKNAISNFQSMVTSTRSPFMSLVLRF